MLLGNFVVGKLAMVYGWRYGCLATVFGRLVGVAMQILCARCLAPAAGGGPSEG